MPAAVLNAISEESTGWYDPSSKVAFRFTTGYPARTPCWHASRRPFSTAGDNSSSARSRRIPFPQMSCPLSGPGSNSIHTCPYCPVPAGTAFLCFPSTLTLLWMVSLYGTMGFSSFTFTPNFVFNLLTITSICCSPCPVDQRLLGFHIICNREGRVSSSISLVKAIGRSSPHRLSPAGDTAIDSTGAGKSDACQDDVFILCAERIARLGFIAAWQPRRYRPP